jgi:hypothetical protein
MILPALVFFYSFIGLAVGLTFTYDVFWAGLTLDRFVAVGSSMALDFSSLCNIMEGWPLTYYLRS